MNDQEILHKYGLSDEWVEKDSARVEDETQSDNLTGVYYYGLPAEHRENDELVTLSVRIPHSLMEAATREAKKVSFDPQRIRTPRPHPSPRIIQNHYQFLMCGVP